MKNPQFRAEIWLKVFTGKHQTERKTRKQTKELVKAHNGRKCVKKLRNLFKRPGERINGTLGGVCSRQMYFEVSKLEVGVEATELPAEVLSCWHMLM